MSTTSPSSTAGSSTSCWDLLKRCTSSRKSMVPWPCSPRRRSALGRAPRARPSRRRRSPTAVTKCLAVVVGQQRASVVLPVPGGPHRMAEVRPGRSRPAPEAGRPGRPGAAGPRPRRGCGGAAGRPAGPGAARRRSAAPAKRLRSLSRPGWCVTAQSSGSWPAAPPPGCPARPGWPRAAASGRRSSGRPRTGSSGRR